MRKIPQNIGLRYKVNQGSKRGFLIQVLLILQSLIKGGGLPLSLKGKIRVSLLCKELLVPSVVEIMKGSVFLVWAVVMDVGTCGLKLKD